MRKYIIIAAAAIVAMASCTKVEKDPTATPDLKIGYQVAEYMTQTKANSSFLDELTGAPFNLTAANVFFKSKAYINAAGSSSAAEFYNAASTTKVENIKYYSGTTATWEPDHTYYWPKSPNSSLDFFSWYDLSATTADTAAGNVASMEESSGTYTLAWTGRTIALKDNVMYADPVWNQKANKNPGDYKYNDVKEGVPTLFHHALAQVRFQFKQKTMSKVDSKNSSNSTFWVVTVKNLAIPANKWVKTGSLSLSATSGNNYSAVTNSIWTPGSEYWASSDVFLAAAAGTTGIVLTDTEVTFTKDDQMSGEYITVLPQAIGNDFLLNFDIVIETKYGTTSDGASAATTVSTELLHVKDFPTGGAIVNNSGIQLNLMTTIGSYWQMNKKYTYIFEIDPETTTILYDPAVEDWAADVSQTQTIPHSNS